MPRLRQTQKDTLVCGLACFACALLSFALSMIQDGGAFTLREDFDFQQLPFTMGLHNQIARGGLAGWCWNLDLGASTIQGFGFYELGSPFFWTSMLFPSWAFPYVVGWLYMAKYMVAGITAFLYARRFVAHPRSAMVCALLYAFSGFQTINLLFYHFHDVVALFPTLLIGLERLMANRRNATPFVLAVFANALVNYFFFVQSFVFLLLYFGFRFAPELWQKGHRHLWHALGRCFAFGVLGVAMAGVLLVPSVIYMFSNPRANSSALSLNNILWDPIQLLFQAQGFLLPADVMHDHNALIVQQWTSTCCWLPMAGPSLAYARLRGRRDWLTRLIIALLVICLSPLLTSAFILFTNIYQRWWYVLVLMGALASAQVVDDPTAFDARHATRTSFIALCAFVALVVAGSLLSGRQLVFHADRFALYVILAALGILATGVLMERWAKKERQGGRALVVCVAAFGVVTTGLALHLYRQGLYVGELLNNITPAEQSMGTLNALELGTRLQMLDPQYRYATGDNRLTLPGDACGISSFSSTVSSASGRFDEFFGTPATNVWHLNKATVPGLTELLGGRYRITTDPSDAEVADQYEVADTTYYVISEPACPLGIIYDQFVVAERAQELPLASRALALMQAPAVADKDRALVNAYATPVETTDLGLTQDASTLARDAQARSVQDFWRTVHGFGFTARMETPSLVYLSIPHDDGWAATVDGQEATIVDSVGMMLLPLEAGVHAVEFHYETPGLRAGAVTSAVAWVIFAAMKCRKTPHKRDII